MFAVYVGLAIVSSLLLAAVSGLGKLRRIPYIVKSVHDLVGVPMRWFPFLAGLEFAAALGLLVGFDGHRSASRRLGVWRFTSWVPSLPTCG